MEVRIVFFGINYKTCFIPGIRFRYVAMVIDRLLLYIFFGVTLGGTLGILLSAPNVFDPVRDQNEIKSRLIKFYKGELED